MLNTNLFISLCVFLIDESIQTARHRLIYSIANLIPRGIRICKHNNAAGFFHAGYQLQSVFIQTCTMRFNGVTVKKLLESGCIILSFYHNHFLYIRFIHCAHP